ncbi:MAG: YetF domain-containing protein [Variovorax sp.]
MGDMFWNIDWHGIFTPTNSLMELVVRGTIMYFVLFGLLRFVMKRQAGGIGTTDVLVIVLLAEVAGNGFAAEYKSVVEGAVLVGTILFWSYTLEWVAHRFAAVERILHAPTLVLIENGKMLRKNMRAELVTKEELMAQLREKGIEDCAQVQRACMEADGMISVIKMK